MLNPKEIARKAAPLSGLAPGPWELARGAEPGTARLGTAPVARRGRSRPRSPVLGEATIVLGRPRAEPG